MSKKKKHNSTKQLKELIIIQTAMFYLTLFLEQAGVIKDNQLVKDKAQDFADVQGAIKLGGQMMFILSRVKMSLQQTALGKANKIMQGTYNSTEFNYLVFVLVLLMEYKENFKQKTYHIPTTYDELNTLFDDYFSIALKDREQMGVINDSMAIAEKFYNEVMSYGNKD